MQTIRSAPFLTIAAVVGVLAPGRAAAAEATWFQSLHDRAGLEPYDPTLISRRLYSELSYENHDYGDEFWKIETTLRWAMPLDDGLALGMQMMVPLKWNETRTTDAEGIGDLELRAGVVGRIAFNVRYGVGLNAVLETATDSDLSGHAFVLRPILAAAWDVNGLLTLGVNFEYNFTPRDEGAYDESALEVKFPAVFHLNDDWSAAIIYKPKFYFIAEDNDHRLELGATRLLGADNQYAWSLGVEIPLADDSLDYKLYTGFAWHF